MVTAVLDARGDSRDIDSMEFLIQWGDTDVTWEKYGAVSQLQILDYFFRHSDDARLHKRAHKRPK